MTRRIIAVIVIGIVIAGLMALAWWWFFNRTSNVPKPTTGTFGSAQNRVGTNPSTGIATDLSAPVAQNGPIASNSKNGTYVLHTLGGSSVGSYTIDQNNSGGVTITPTDGSGVLTNGTYTVDIDGLVYTVDITGTTTTLTPPATNETGPGDWLSVPPTDFSSTTALATTLTNTDTTNIPFNPKAVGTVFSDDTNPYNIGVVPDISGSSNSSKSGGLGIAGALLGAGLAGGLSCGAAQAFNLTTTATNAAAGGTAGAAAGALGTAAGVAATPVSVQTVDLGNYVAQGGAASALGTLLGGINGGNLSNFATNTFFSCLARTVAKVALQQITSSVVNWINSGFNGSPSFVTNPTQFFTNVADTAAGQFIKGSALSFLCSPFKLQIKIAVAQSYAKRNDAQSCTLTKVIGNVNSFMNGNFSAGGWAGMLAFTGTPTNNPYGAYAAASIGLSYAVQTATGAQQRELSLGNGFLDFKKKQNCQSSRTPPTASADKSVTPIASGDRVNDSDLYEVCDLVHTTPGKVIQDSLSSTMGSTFQELGLAKNFDEIISALITQLVTRTLQGGLSNLSGNNGYQSNFYTPDQLSAQTDAQALVLQLQADSQTAQSYGGVQQGSVQDVENTQNKLNTTFNCWNNVAMASSSNYATGMALSASTTLAQLDSQIDAYNNEISRANGAVTALIQLENSALAAASTADTKTVTSSYANAKVNGQLISVADLANAQQNRTTLQNKLQTIEADTQSSLAQCNDSQ